MTVVTERVTTSVPTMPSGPFAQAVKHGGLVYVAGQVAYDHEHGRAAGPDIGTQTAQAIQNLRSVLMAAGSDLDRVIKVTCILPHFARDYREFNVAYAAAFGEHRPARTTIQAGLLGDYIVEIEAIAAI